MPVSLVAWIERSEIREYCANTAQLPRVSPTLNPGYGLVGVPCR
jgi:hypothetical protein